jgi:hypothetical protein
VSGLAHIGSGDKVEVSTGDGRTFQYFHITPAVSPGEPVTAYTTMLGRVKPTSQHVHLSEIDDFRVHNPLDPGHLEPYTDHTIPEIHQLSFTTDGGAPLQAHNLHGTIVVTADAEDTPPLPVPGHWLGFPVAPALVTWHLKSRTGTTVQRVTAADFRHTEPPSSDFWDIYAAGTYQNFPDFTHHLYWHRPGRYLFNLTTTPLDTRRFPNGTYRISVTAADTCSNRSTLSEQIRIANPRHALSMRQHDSGWGIR